MKDIWHTISGIRKSTGMRVKTRKPANIGISLPTRQVSRDEPTDHLNVVRGNLSFLKPGYQFDVIPILRKLKDANPDMSQAFKDVIQLANTGHEITFDSGVPASQQQAMRHEILTASRHWVEGAAGIHGIVNKMFAQLLIGGAISNEWVPNFQLDALEKIKFVEPENIRWAKKKGQTKYAPYQKVNSGIMDNTSAKLIDGQYIELNPNTFRYYALLGDAESPYGIPPYLASLTGISTQNKMLENINQIVSTMGILGWSEALMEKPMQDNGESDKQYATRLNNILQDLKARVGLQLQDGVAVGFKDDHEFDFKQTVTSAQGVDSLWAHNEQQIASALDFDSAFMGRSYNTSESMITILFTKMISQLNNIQNTIEHNLNYGLDLHLRLKGFNFKYVKTEFNKSTITDDLKYQQAMEIKGRVALQNYLMGTIDEHMYARAMSYDSPVEKKPRIAPELLAGKGQAQSDKENKEKRKDKSERESRAKRKEGPVQRTKPVTSN